MIPLGRTDMRIDRDTDRSGEYGRTVLSQVQQVRLIREEPQLRAAADLIETCMLLLFFSWLLLKGFLAQRDTLYTHVGGLVLFAFTFLRYQKQIFVIGRTVVFYAALVSLACLSALWAYDEHLVFLEAREMVAAIFSMLAVHKICETPAGVKRVLFALKAVLLLGIAGAMASGAYSYSGREFLLLQSGAIAPFLLMGFAAAFLEAHMRNRRTLAFICMAFALIPMLIVSSVRAVAVVVVILAVYILLTSFTSVAGRIFAGATAIVALSLAIMYGSTLATAFEGTRYYRHYSHTVAYVDEGALEGSVGFRVMVQDLAWDMIRERPVTGHGLNNSRYLYERWIGMPTYSHSGYTELLIGLGIVGIVAFFLVFSEPFRGFMRTWQTNKRAAAAGFGVMFGLLAFNFVGPVYSSLELLTALVMLGSPGVLVLLRSSSWSSTKIRVGKGAWLSGSCSSPSQ